MIKTLTALLALAYIAPAIKAENCDKMEYRWKGRMHLSQHMKKLKHQDMKRTEQMCNAQAQKIQVYCCYGPKHALLLGPEEHGYGTNYDSFFLRKVKCCSQCKKAKDSPECKKKRLEKQEKDRRNDFTGRRWKGEGGQRDSLATIKFHNDHDLKSIQYNGKVFVKFDVRNKCTKTEERTILKNMDNIKIIIRTAYQRWDKNRGLFQKWFGTSSAWNDENVKLRFKRAMNVMFAENRKWSLQCCKKFTGGCKPCKYDKWGAFVKKTSNDERYISNTNIRVCKPYKGGFDQISGWNMFREVLLMTSNLNNNVDLRKSLYKSKKEVLGKSGRGKRYEADAYIYYAQEAGMTKAPEPTVTYDNGFRFLGRGCKTIIEQLGNGCCGSAQFPGIFRWYSHLQLRDKCPQACRQVDSSKKCFERKVSYAIGKCKENQKTKNNCKKKDIEAAIKKEEADFAAKLARIKAKKEKEEKAAADRKRRWAEYQAQRRAAAAAQKIVDAAARKKKAREDAAARKKKAREDAAAKEKKAREDAAKEKKAREDAAKKAADVAAKEKKALEDADITEFARKLASTTKAQKEKSCYLRYCNMPTNKDLMNAFCGGKHCHTQGSYDSCKKHWHEFGAKENRKGNPIACITKSEEHFCYLRYCNARRNSDLKNAFCGGKHCDTQGQSDSCKKHWHEFGLKENRERSPAYCLNQLAKKKAATEAKAKAFQYKFFKTKHTWQNARTACKRWGGTLASIKSAAEQKFFLKTTKRSGNDRFTWIGANDLKKTYDWRWLDGSKIQYSNWRYSRHNRNCATVDYWGGKWDDQYCDCTLSFICEKNRGRNLPKKYQQHQEPQALANKYKFFRTWRSWHGAQAACKKWGGALASIKSAGENFVVLGLIGKLTSRATWFGANDIKKEGAWRWADGFNSEVKYTNWAPNQPNDWNHSQDCAALRGSSGKWKDYSCNKPAQYICEKSKALA